MIYGIIIIVHAGTIMKTHGDDVQRRDIATLPGGPNGRRCVDEAARRRQPSGRARTTLHFPPREKLRGRRRLTRAHTELYDDGVRTHRHAGVTNGHCTAAHYTTTVDRKLFGAHARTTERREKYHVHIYIYHDSITYENSRSYDDGCTTHYVHGRMAALDSRRRLAATRATAAGGGGGDDDSGGGGGGVAVSVVRRRWRRSEYPAPRSAARRTS